MMTARTYGFGGFTSAAYYWEGIAGNFAKFLNGGGGVEAAYLGGQQSTFGAPVSNLGRRRIDVYSNTRAATRFDLTFPAGIITVIPVFLRRPMLVPTDPAWAAWGP